MADDRPTNDGIADMLEQISDLLEAQDANRFRVRAYRNAAQSVRTADRSVAVWVRGEGKAAIQSLPGVGERLASVIDEYVRTGRSSQLSRLQGEVSPEDLFAQVPGIGDVLAERIASQLDVNTLEELEMAAHDGRLREVEGFGPERVYAVRTSLAGMLGRSARRRSKGDEDDDARPSIGSLLSVDSEYRRRAEAGELHKIAPKRFNPEGEAWLPILHTSRKGWDYAALYSNTKRAHDLGKTHDWVVLYYDRDSKEGQATVVTEQSGPLAGERVVRGREAEARRYYEGQDEGS
jgi:DNA polymerase (family 10)